MSAEHSTPEERTELPTGRRMDKLRREGQIFLSVELVQLISLLTGFLLFGMLGPWMNHNLQLIMVRSYHMIGDNELLTVEGLHRGFLGLLWISAPPVLILVFGVAASAFLATMLQTKWNIREKKIKFKWPMLNPLGGVRRMFSLNNLVTVFKALAKLGMMIPIGYFALKAFAPQMVMLVHLQLTDIMAFTTKAMGTLFWKLLYVFIALAIFDYAYGRWQWYRTYKMTKEEVKDERKAIEGDEATKRKMQNKAMQRAMRRIMQTVPKADVVITNPTHFAVALKYERGKMGAPQVVAKGKGFIALKIREIAAAHGVPIIERKPLARALFASVEVGAEIPRELFRAVAEVLAHVFKQRGPGRATTSNARRNNR